MTPGDIIIWSLALIGLLLVGFIAASLAKRRLSQGDATPAGGFNLSELRALHKKGQMSDEEFKRAKEAVVAATRRATERELAAKKQRDRHDLQP